eukprot:COSAG06_NODE_2047_length_7748_cov_2.928880_4_plen_90_part_00
MGLLRPVWRMTDTSSSSSSGGGGGRGGTGVPQNHWRRVSTLPEARGFPAAVYAAAVPQPHHQQQKEWEEGQRRWYGGHAVCDRWLRCAY